jgi:hypothetical protein
LALWSAQIVGRGKADPGAQYTEFSLAVLIIVRVFELKPNIAVACDNPVTTNQAIAQEELQRQSARATTLTSFVAANFVSS